MSSIGWKTTRRRQLYLGGAITLLVVLLTMGIVLLVHGPFQAALYRRDNEQFRAYGLFIRSEVSSYFDQSIQLAQQIPSRTSIRDELVAYLQGERTRESYVAFAQPKLADAIDAAPALLGVYRCSSTGERLVRVNITDDQLPLPLPKLDSTQVIPNPVVVDGEKALLFIAPIWQPDFGIAGHDVVAVSIAELAERVEDASARTGDARVALLFRGNEDLAIPLHSENSDAQFLQSLRTAYAPGVTDPSKLEVGDRVFTTLSFELRDDWIVTVSQELEELRKSSTLDTRLFTFAVILLGLVASIGSTLFLRLIAHRNVADTEELNRIIRQQTEDLELLLTEVHHRVKNDISLMSSFISLKANRAKEPEARRALTEARQTLLLMRRTYERLQATGEYGTVPLKPMLEGIAGDIRSAGDGDYTITSDLQNISVNRRIAIPLGIIANELLTNAVKHGTPGMEITLTLAKHEDDGVLIEVANNQGTFPQSVLDGDYGFGLSMVAAITEQHSGSMSLLNDPTANVVIRLPGVDESTGVEEPT